LGLRKFFYRGYLLGARDKKKAEQARDALYGWGGARMKGKGEFHTYFILGSSNFILF